MKQFYLLSIILWSVYCMPSFSQKISAKDKKDIERQYIDLCKSINQQCPLVVDKVTSLRSVTFANWNLCSTYVIDIDLSDVSEADIEEMMNKLRENLKGNIPKMFSCGNYGVKQKDFGLLLKGTGMKIRMSYYDANNTYIGSIVYDYRDF